MRTRSQTKKLALAAEAKEKELQTKAIEQNIEISIPVKLPKLDNDIMRIIRDKIEKTAVFNLKQELPPAIAGNDEDKWRILAKYTEFGVLTEDLEMSNMEICILHLPIMYQERVYAYFGGSCGWEYPGSMESLISYDYIQKIEDAIDWFNYVRLPNDINNFKYTRPLMPHNNADDLDEDFLLERQENYIIEQSGERYLLARRFPSFVYEWLVERNHKIYCRKIRGLKRYISKHTPAVVEID